LQGIFIAVLYCFLNSEIQNAVKRQLSKVPIEFFKPRQRFETERTYVPENRNITKHGMPMEELECVKETPQEMVPNAQIFALSTSPVTLSSDNTK
uniref:Anoctamin n=1 Tax=Angiostrongylus cantonensis TaxID=6313 RepID=A0A0K0D7M5_ANGCA